MLYKTFIAPQSWSTPVQRAFNALSHQLTRGVINGLCTSAFIRASDANSISSLSPISSKRSQHIRTYNKRSRLRAYTSEENATIIKLRSEWASWPTIQQALPGQTVGSLRARYTGYVRQPHHEGAWHINRFTSSEEERIRKLKNSGLTWLEV